MKPNCAFKIFSQLLDYGIPLPSDPLPKEVVRRCELGSEGEAVEILLAALSSNRAVIQVDFNYLRELTAQTGDKTELFPFLRDGLFDELGVEFPRFHFAERFSRNPRTFRFQINELTTHPYDGRIH